MTSLAGNTSHIDPVAAQIRSIGTLLTKGQNAEAERAALDLVNRHPERHDAHNMMGVIYVSRKKRNRAVPHFEAAVRAQPANPAYLNNLGRLYLDLDLLELALPPLNRALSINPNISETLWAIGEYYRDTGKAEKGLPYLEKALALDPGNGIIKTSYADSLDALGRSDEARRGFEALVSSRRQKPLALFRLSQLGKPKTDSPLFADIQAMLKSEDLGRRDMSRLHSAAAHVYENSGDFHRAFEHFEQSNKLQDKSYAIGKYRAWVDTLIEIFTPEFFAQRRALGHPSDLPVFIVGMPRSGTTLTELIIASHPQAGGAGELARMSRFAGGLGYRKTPLEFPAAFDAMDRQQITDLAENFLNLLRFHVPDAIRIVDKMPHNFEVLGFIALLFPNARIIHCNRNPIATCWSCYENRLSDSHPYSRDLTTLGLYYREYARLMDHWRKVLPAPVYESSYEALTDDPEANVRAILEFLGLPWEPACLDFHKSGATVSTMSRIQVRQPVNKSAVDRWRRYENELKPLIDALGDAVEKPGR